MSNYKIDKDNKYQSVVQIRDLDGYDFRPRNKVNQVTVSKVTIVDNLMIDKILSVNNKKNPCQKQGSFVPIIKEGREQLKGDSK